MPRRIVIPPDTRIGFWPSALIIGLSAACIYLFFWGSPIRDNQTESTPTTKPVEPLIVAPREVPLRCEQGKWVTQLASWEQASEQSAALRDVQNRMKDHSLNLRLYYTRIDKDQCNIPGGYSVLWSGPYPTAGAAMGICNRLGWKTANDWRHCFGRVIDTNHKGKKRIRPDGSYF